MKKKTIILNTRQYKNKTLRRAFTTGGFDVVEEKSINELMNRNIDARKNDIYPLLREK